MAIEFEDQECTVTFRVNGEPDGHLVEVPFKLFHSGGFNYGNGTGVIMFEGKPQEQMFDTRYETYPIISDFKGWCKEFVMQRFLVGDGKTVEVR